MLGQHIGTSHGQDPTGLDTDHSYSREQSAKVYGMREQMDRTEQHTETVVICTSSGCIRTEKIGCV